MHASCQNFLSSLLPFRLPASINDVNRWRSCCWIFQLQK
jgi:hypothetical protein